MSICKTGRLLVGVFAALCLAGTATANVYIWEGSRSTADPPSVVASDGWMESQGGFEISWRITGIGDSLEGVTEWTYEYTLANRYVYQGSPLVPLNPEESHMILEVSNPFVLLSTDVNLTVTAPKQWTSSGTKGDTPNMLDGGIYGISLASSVVTYYSFTSSNPPMWGDFYVKDGKHDGVFATAWNTGFGTNPGENTTDFTAWVLVPDTGGQELPPPSSTIIPLPGALFLGVVGVGLVAFARRVRR